MGCLKLFSNNCRSSCAFGRRLVQNFGWKFCVLIAVMYYGVKGVVLSVTRMVQLSYCKKSLHIDGIACQTMGVIAATPWALKGAIGVLSDIYPCCGFHKVSLDEFFELILAVKEDQCRHRMCSSLLSLGQRPSRVLQAFLQALHLSPQHCSLLRISRFSVPLFLLVTPRR